MRAVACLLFGAIALGSLVAQTSADQARVRTRHLAIESETLSGPDREKIVHKFEANAYPTWGTAELAGEMRDRVRDSLQILGYFRASVAEPKISFLRKAGDTTVIDMTVAVEEGPRYYMGEIRFRNAKAFPTTRLRQAFLIQTGDVFDTEKIREGMLNLSSLYDSEGYLYFMDVPVTTTDDSRHIVDLRFDLDEGKVFFFGPLVLDGPEPRAGAGQALLKSWSLLKGRRYSGEVLLRWFIENRVNLPAGEHIYSDLVQTFPDPGSQIVTVKFSFPLPAS